MWYSETLWIIIRKGTGGDSLAVNDRENNDIRNNHVKHNSASRRHNCSNYGGFCRNLTCPESSGFHLNSYSLSKTKHGKIAIQVNTTMIIIKTALIVQQLRLNQYFLQNDIIKRKAYIFQ